MKLGAIVFFWILVADSRSSSPTRSAHARGCGRGTEKEAEEEKNSYTCLSGVDGVEKDSCPYLGGFKGEERDNCPQPALAPTMTISKLIRRLIIMGPPGSGKGTVSGRIQKTFNSFHLSSGDLLRAQITAKTKEGILAEGYIAKGTLVPDDVMVNLILNALKDQEAKMTSGSWLLDGFPRTTSQAASLHASLPADFVINLDVPFDVIIDRVRGRWVHLPSGRVYNEDWNPPKEPGKDDVTGEPLSKRDDDRPETVATRLSAYQQQTQPVLDFYRRQNEAAVKNFQGTETNVIWPMVKAFLEEKL